MIQIIFFCAAENFINFFEPKYLENLNLQAEISRLQGQVIFTNDVNSDLKQVFEQNKLSSSENQIVFLSESGDYLAHRTNPELEYDWLSICNTFLENYHDKNPDERGFYKWGQIVPTSTEYLCVDCGYIETFEVGQVFPICEVCLSGDPATEPNYSGPDQGYWEMV